MDTKSVCFFLAFAKAYINPKIIVNVIPNCLLKVVECILCIVLRLCRCNLQYIVEDVVASLLDMSTSSDIFASHGATLGSRDIYGKNVNEKKYRNY